MFKIIGADRQEYGPVSTEVIERWIAEGRANGQTRVLPEGATDWKALADLPEFKDALIKSGADAPGAAGPAPAVFPVAPAAKANSLALAGLVLGILSLTFGLCCFAGLPFSIAGMVCSITALSRIKAAPGQSGRPLAIAGLVLSLINILIVIVFIAAEVAFRSHGMMHRMYRL